jgi:hypothetical protein
MSRGTLSNESRLAVALQGLGCSQRAFAALFDLKYSQFAAVMADQSGVKNFSREESENMAERVQEMADLQQAVNKIHGVPTPLNWNDSRIGDVLAIRKVAALDREIGRSSLDQLAFQETERIARQQ